MKRTRHWLAWQGGGGATLAAAIVILTGARVAQAVLEVQLSPPEYMVLVDTVDRFFLGFHAGVADNGLPPAPSADFLNFSQTLDRTTLEGEPADGRFWTFTFGASADYVKNPDGSLARLENLVFRLFGQHLMGHPGTVNPNNLELIATDPVTLAADHTYIHKLAANEVKHRHDDGTHGIDTYSMSGFFRAGSSVLNPLLHGPADVNLTIIAQHKDPPPPRTSMLPRRTGMTLGGPTFVLVDADGGGSSVIFSANQVTSLERQPPSSGGGGSSGEAQALALAGTANAVDPEFVDDPLLDFSIIRIESVAAGGDAVSYVGFDADRGLHVFSGGSLAIEHFGFGPADFSFNSTFDEMLHDPTSGEFFALLNRVSYTDFPEQAGYSAFLDQFTDAHLFGGDPRSRGIMFTFNMPGMAEATNNFTQPYFPEEPTTFFLTGVLLVPEPATTALFPIAFCILAAQRGMTARSSRSSLRRTAASRQSRSGSS